MSNPLEQSVSELLKSRGVLTESDAEKKREKFGKNSIPVHIPSMGKLLIEQLMTPIPLFEFFCCVLWLLEDEYWKYMIFTLLSIVGFEFSTVVQKRKNLSTLESISKRLDVEVEVLRDGRTYQKTRAELLVPGDVIRLGVRGSSGGSASMVVPADCAIIRGGAVVNEASLTGESVPQMKLPLPAETRKVDVSGDDKSCVLFAGTELIIRDETCECVVLRIGESSSHGELLQMIKHSQADVKGNKSQVFRLLVLLLLCAIVASSYVFSQWYFQTGPEKLNNMTTYKLLLRCVMIVTSVVPPELPVQMTLAVNSALMALQKNSILCTDPNKVPVSGSVAFCLFDKTGTITSDQLALTSISGASSFQKEALYVCAACHSLFPVTPESTELSGDPIELAAFVAHKDVLSFDAATNTATVNGRKLEIVQRFPFSATTKRMAVVVRDPLSSETLALVKGSPEIIGERLRLKPADFDRDYENLSRQGKRVLAFATKVLSTGPAGGAGGFKREEVERDLEFCGFAAFACETRADSKLVISALQNAEITSVIITGDAALTAEHVARQVGIIKRPTLTLSLAPSSSSGSQGSAAQWSDGAKFLGGAEIATRAQVYDLVTCGETLERHPELLPLVPGNFQVLARTNPRQKESLVQAFRNFGTSERAVLMCGDGGNDVGALKAADVGLALLGGFGATNTSMSADSGEGDIEEDAEEKIERDNKIKKLVEAENTKKFQQAMGERRKHWSQFQQAWLQEELAKLGGAEQAGISGHFQAAKAVARRLKEATDKDAKELYGKFGVQSVWDQAMAAAAGGGGGEGAGGAGNGSSRTQVSIGDASIAASFTSRHPSIRGVLQIIRQGRCTLLVAVQQMQIMMLECLISAYTLAAVTMEGGKATELQLIFSGILVLVASVAFTYARPAKKLSSVLPLSSVFHPAIFLSVVVQVLLHLTVMLHALKMAKAAMGEEALADLYTFEKARDEKLTTLIAQNEEDGSVFGLDFLSMFRSVPYRPNLLNTVMFLVKTAQQVAVLVVNYKGSPWMQGATENKALFIACFLCAAGLFVCSSGTVPELNEFLELMVLPQDLRNHVLALLLVSTIGAFLLDRLVLLVFARQIFLASTWRPLLSTRLADFVPILETLVYVAGGVVLLPMVLGNPLMMIGAFYLYKQYKAYQAQQDAQLLKQYTGAGEKTPIKQD